MNTTTEGINYNFDEHLEFKDVHNIETAEGFSFQVSELQRNPVDIRVNNNTNLILAQKNINSKTLIDKTKELRDRLSIPSKLTTYLAPVENVNVDMPAKFTVVDESISNEDIMCVGVEAKVEKVFNSIAGLENRHFFELEFLEEYGNFVKISHYDTRKTLLLTYNHITNEIYFDFPGAPAMSSKVLSDMCFSFTTYADPRTDPQIFEYRLDDKYGYISLSKSRPDNNGGFTLLNLTYATSSDTLIANEAPITSLSELELLPSFKIDLPTDISSNELRSSIVSYDRVGLNINPDTLIPDTKQNILLYDEYKSGKDNTSNMIFLKNQFPNTFEGTTNNIVPGSNRADYRDYTSIIAGGNQIRGTDKVGVLFNDHTAEIKLNANQITYFHLPVEMYPYVKLYIGDCGLIESGAIFGDAPINSDKIFKKLASYKQSTPNGEPTDDQMGSWACSWLYSPTGKTEDAMWVDRYYDSESHSFNSALQSSVTTIYDSIIEAKNDYSVMGEEIKSIFDVKSTMMLEPDTYYAYHHIGVADLETYVENEFGKNIIVQDTIPRELDSETTYRLGDVDAKAGITISFTIEKKPTASWSEPIAYHILGNYSNAGISIFNNLRYTPVIYSRSKSGDDVRLFNDDFKLLNNINNEVTNPSISATPYERKDLIDTKIKFITILEPLGNIYCLTQDSDNQLYIYEYSMGGGVIEFTKLYEIITDTETRYYKGKIHSVCAYDNTMCIYIDDKIIVIDLIAERIIHTVDSDRVKINVTEKTLRVVGSLYETDNSIFQVTDNHQEDRLMFLGDGVTIKSFSRTSTGEVFIIYSDDTTGGLEDYVVCFNTRGDRVFSSVSITEYLSSVGITWDSIDSKYNCIVHYDGNLEQDHQLHIFTEIDETLIHIKTSSTGDIISSNQFTNDSETGIDIDSITNFSYFQGNKPNTLTIKHKLNNLINRDDITTLSIDIDVLQNFYDDKHHIIYDFDPQSGTATVYIDGDIHSIDVLDDIMYKDTGNFKPPGKFTFSLFHVDDFRVGEIPYINNSELSSFIQKQERPVNTNFKISDFKMFNRSLSKYAAKQIAAQTDQIDSITWTVPYTKRHFIDNIDKVQKHEIPGIKSNTMSINLHTNESIDDSLINDISVEVNEKIKEFIPSNVNLTSIDWI